MLTKELYLTEPAWPATSDGVFEDGSATMLWNPNLSMADWRREKLRAALKPATALGRLASFAIAVTGAFLWNGFGLVLSITLGVAILGSTALAAIVELEFFATDHVHRRGAKCRLERPGQFFYRSADFMTASSTAYAMASDIIAAVDQLHASPACVWIGRSALREVHLAAWNALLLLDQTRTARDFANQLHAESSVGELRMLVDDALATSDQTTERVLSHLNACVTLAQAWSEKLQRANLNDRAVTVLESLRKLQVVRADVAAESLPQVIFAYITAARDVTNAGPFPWEKPWGVDTASISLVPTCQSKNQFQVN
ncbi:hypothetical protein [Amycolatopsis sp. H20-H5]|uniref:hypothetical protein n=1 Tax=Amycolatopsis sp. H20-H5 TaxID=3046309 RepID=UPI002DBE6C0C|nr:hypothetical protein [Amycolatopsis sp. H20-H5]MEC3978889.1 hypothetical protein [Amycolatopsis sp. H20-H5]